LSKHVVLTFVEVVEQGSLVGGVRSHFGTDDLVRAKVCPHFSIPERLQAASGLPGKRESLAPWWAGLLGWTFRESAAWAVVP
jgi:hypothetical protein